jgi:two-component system OmpR family response regulator
MKTRILIIDDEAGFSHWMKRSLEANGYYDVREENDPALALDAAREFAPEVVLLDVMMPETDGSEVAARFGRDPFLRDVPVLFLTDLVSGREAPAGACSSGGRTFLPKSIPIAKLISCIDERLRTAVALSA